MLQDHIPSYQTYFRTTQIMTYELGGIIRSLVYAEHMGRQGRKDRQKAYLAEARVGLADLMTQSQLLAEQMGWRPIDLENDGLERFLERMQEIKEGKL